MTNMSYCRFENTLKDLTEAYDYLDVLDKDLSTEELRARRELIKLCKDISEQWGE